MATQLWKINRRYPNGVRIGLASGTPSDAAVEAAGQDGGARMINSATDGWRGNGAASAVRSPAPGRLPST